MIRLIKRYGGTSRKLYDTEESRYVSLEDLSAWIRAGQEVRVVDSQSGAEVTAQTLAQAIFEDHRRGSALFSVDFLHQAIRRGSKAFTEGFGQVQEKVDHLVRLSLDHVAFSGASRADVDLLQRRLTELEATLADFETITPTRSGFSPSGASRRTNH
jgi:polyhydroxyalkanoate synthesis repressor PhaR